GGVGGGDVPAGPRLAPPRAGRVVEAGPEGDTGRARRRDRAGDRAAPRLRVRLDRLRRDGGALARGAGARAAGHPHRALRRRAMTHLDGNVLAGALAEVLVPEVTGLVCGCGADAALGQAVVYTDAPGLVARCASCDHVLLTLVDAGDRRYLSLRGVDVVVLER